MKKKLLLIWPYFPPDPGAAAIRGLAYYKYLQEDFDVHVITKNNKKFEEYKDLDNVKRINLNIKLRFDKFFQDYKKLKSAVVKVKPDITIVSSPNVQLAFITALICKRLKIKYILDVRDMTFNRGFLKTKVYKFIENYSYKNAHKVFVTTDIQKNLTVKRYKINENKIFVVSNGVDLSLFKNTSTQDKTIDLIFVGSINPERNVEGVIDFLKEVYRLRPETKVTFVGFDSTNEFARIAKEKLETISQNIEIIGEVSHSEVANLIAKSHSGLVSIADYKHLNYMMPVKVFEYMAAGLFVVALISKTSDALEEFMQKSKSGIYSQDSFKLAEAFVNVIDNPEEVQKFNLNNEQLIKKYDRQAIVKNIANEIK
jgi:glycosyltransferase involved in cell wall biosynthesis